MFLALDWTWWDDRFSLLVASVAVDKRAGSVALSAVHKRLLAGWQNLCEETFRRLCVERLKNVGIKAVWRCERGFRRLARLDTL